MVGKIKTLPEFILLEYEKAANNLFEQVKATEPAKKFSKILSIEPTECSSIGASNCLVEPLNKVWSRQLKKKTSKLITGLRATAFQNIFVGDILERKKTKTSERKKSILIVHLSPNGNRLKLYYFRSYSVYAGRLKEFVQQFVEYRKTQKELN